MSERFELHKYVVALERCERNVAELKTQLAEAIRERDLAVAHDRQPYPTADAYEKVCAALEKHRKRADEAKAQLAEAQAENWRLREVAEAADAHHEAERAHGLNSTQEARAHRALMDALARHRRHCTARDTTITKEKTNG